MFLWAALLGLQTNWGRKGAQEFPSLSREQDQLGRQEQVAQAYLILKKLFFTSSRNLISVFMSDLPAVFCLDQLGFLCLMAVVVWLLFGAHKAVCTSSLSQSCSLSFSHRSDASSPDVLVAFC